MSEIGWAAGGPRKQPVRQGSHGPGPGADQGADGVRAASGEACACAGCSGTRGATRRAATRSATGAATRACDRRAAKKSRRGGRSSGSRAGDPGPSDRRGSGRCARAGPPPRPAPAAGAAAEELLRRRPADAAGAPRLRAHGARRAWACCGCSCAGRRSSPATAAGDYDWSAPDAVIGEAAALRHPDPAVRLRRPELGVWRGGTVAARRVPAVRADRLRGARRLGAVPRRGGRPLRARTAASGRCTRSSRGFRSARGRSGTSRTPPPSSARGPTSGPTRELLAAARDAIAARDPGARSRPRRHVRHPPRRPEAGDRRRGLPRAGSTAGPGRPGLRRCRPPPLRRRADGVIDQVGLLRDEIERAGDDARPLDHRDRLGLGRLAASAQPRPAGQAERLRKDVPLLPRATAGGWESRPSTGTRGATAPRPRRRPLRLVPALGAARARTGRPSPHSRLLGRRRCQLALRGCELSSARLRAPACLRSASPAARTPARRRARRPPLRPAPEEFFGVVPQTLLTDDDLDRMEQGKVGTLRIVVPWGALDHDAEGGRPRLLRRSTRWSSARPQRGIRVLPTIYGTPAWVAEDLDGYDCGDACGTYAPHSPEALAEWKSFIAALVDRWGPGGDALGGPSRRRRGTGPHLADLERAELPHLLSAQGRPRPPTRPCSRPPPRRSTNATRTRGRPRRHVRDPVQGRAAGARRARTSCASCTRSMAPATTFDDIAAHPYAASRGQDRAAGGAPARRDRRPPTTTPGCGSPRSAPPPRRASNPLERGPEGQADQLREAFDFFLEQRQEWNIQGVTWYSWRDTPSDASQCDWCAGSGLFQDERARPEAGLGRVRLLYRRVLGPLSARPPSRAG